MEVSSPSIRSTRRPSASTSSRTVPEVACSWLMKVPVATVRGALALGGLDGAADDASGVAAAEAVPGPPAVGEADAGGAGG